MRAHSARQHNTRINHDVHMSEETARRYSTDALKGPPPPANLYAGVRAQLFEGSPVVCTHLSRVQCLVMTAREDSGPLTDWEHLNTPGAELLGLVH